MASSETPQATPGPWHWANRDQLVGPDQQPVLRGHVVWQWSEPQAALLVSPADARLLASAPVLLEALTDVTRVIEDWPHPEAPIHDWLLELTRAAIARAKGGG
jgi:hypothetical protein